MPDVQLPAADFPQAWGDFQQPQASQLSGTMFNFQSSPAPSPTGQIVLAPNSAAGSSLTAAAVGPTNKRSASAISDQHPVVIR
jgi:hypothetical protein